MSAVARLVGSVLFPVLLATAAAGYREGPPPAHSGGFADGTCQTCHFDNNLNNAAGSLMLEGVPAGFLAAERYRLRVTLVRPGLAAAGFQLAVRVAWGADGGRQAGTLTSTDDRVQVVRDADSGIVYAQHTEPGAVASGSATWVMDWSPGPQTETVVFHLAANAANDDASEFGDFIYTGQASSRPR